MMEFNKGRTGRKIFQFFERHFTANDLQKFIYRLKIGICFKYNTAITGYNFFSAYPVLTIK